MGLHLSHSHLTDLYMWNSLSVLSRCILQTLLRECSINRIIWTVLDSSLETHQPPTEVSGCFWLLKSVFMNLNSSLFKRTICDMCNSLPTSAGVKFGSWTSEGLRQRRADAHGYAAAEWRLRASTWCDITLSEGRRHWQMNTRFCVRGW